mmetsp:Transcript_31805/g.92958  ORF Transcript_31805/g.92958 Transcript_31805/m.92958 type:complete len:206 (-) Transcript_31805:1039-1656(-)
MAAIPRAVVVVARLLAVTSVVLSVVGDQILQGKTVVRSDEVDRMERTPSAVPEEVGAAADACGEFTLHPLVALNEGAHGVAEFTIPLRPTGRSARREVTHEVAVGPRTIPRLGDELNVLEIRVVGHPTDDLRLALDFTVASSAECRSQVETKSIHAHVQCPVPQARQNPIRAHRIVGVHGVAATGVVRVMAMAKEVIIRPRDRLP